MYTEYAGGSTVFLNVDYDALHFHMGSYKINIFKVLSWEGVTKKEYSVYAFDNVDNSGRPVLGVIELYCRGNKLYLS